MTDERMTDERALSVRQPWTWLIVQGYKPIENRTRSTNFRGFFYVHASKWPKTTTDFHVFGAACDWVRREFGIYVPGEECLKQRGRIIGCAELFQVVEPFSCSSKWHERERFGWVLRNAAPIVPTFEHSGALGFFRLPARVVDVLSQTPRYQPRAVR